MKNCSFKILILLFSVFLQNNISAQITLPNQLPGLTLWLRADSAVVISGSNVAQWNDCSGNNYHASQANIINQPQYILNGCCDRPAIHFDGIDDLLNGVTIPNINTSSISLFVVSKGYSQTGVIAGFFEINDYSFLRRMYSGDSNLELINNGANLFSPQGSLPNAGFNCKILEAVKNYNTVTTLFINGTSQAISIDAILNGAFSNGSYHLGYAQGWDYLNGEISEIILYNSALSANDRISVEQYLINKYAPPVNLGIDVLSNNFCNTVLDAGPCFVSYLWNTGATTQNISVNSSGAYSVTATDVFGYTSVDTINVTYPTINLNDTSFCTGSSVTLSTGLIGSYIYHWSTNATTPTITVNTPGTYAVTATDTSGCSQVNTVTVIEDNFSFIASLSNDTTLCTGNSLSLIIPDPLPPGLSYLWSTGATTPTIQATITGDYSVTITNNIGCIARDTIHVTIAGVAPAVNFLFNSACAGDIVQFTNTSIPAGTSWYWDFGNGSNSIIENPSHIYNLAGSYIVTLVVTDGTCSNSISQIVQIYQPPTVNFTYSDSLCVAFPENFYDQSIPALGSSIIAWDWNFGDGSLNSILQNSIHVYAQSGNYIVNLTTFDDNGCQASFSDTIYISNTCGTGIDNQENMEYVFLYPNPTNDNLLIETLQKATIQILSIHGQLIKTFTATENKSTMDVSSLPAGVYIVQVRTEKGVAVKKFIKE